MLCALCQLLAGKEFDDLAMDWKCRSHLARLETYISIIMSKSGGKVSYLRFGIFGNVVPKWF
jgi:hypothetical protein